MHQYQNKIAFFYAVKNIGGAQLLFARVAVQLLKKGADVLIIDYSDGFIINYLREEGFKPDFIEYKDEKINIQENICLIQHLSSVHTISSKLSFTSASTFLFWSIHPHNVASLSILTPFYTRAPYRYSKWVMRCFEPLRRRRVKSLLSDLHYKGALHYMDVSNFRPSSEVGLIDITPDYLPIPVLDKIGTKKRNNFEETHFGWIGRITDEKVNSFNHIVSGLSKMSEKYNLVFHIIGYGDKEILKRHPNLRVIDHGVVGKEKLDALLLNEIDCIFAMGTSVLESAALGIPSVLSDVSKRPFPQNYKYKWLYETTGFSLGEEAQTSIGTIDFEDVCKIVFDKDLYYIAGENCYDYAKKNHSIIAISDKVMHLSNTSTFTFENLKSFYPE